MQYRLDVVVLPVSDVDAAKAFYVGGLGFHLDVDIAVRPGVRVVRMTPPGSACAVTLGEGLGHDMTPGSVRGLQLSVEDVEATQRYLRGRGVDPGEVRHLGPPGLPGGRCLFLDDPDGNGWAIQEWPRPLAVGAGDDDEPT